MHSIPRSAAAYTCIPQNNTHTAISKQQPCSCAFRAALQPTVACPKSERLRAQKFRSNSYAQHSTQSCSQPTVASPNATTHTSISKKSHTQHYTGLGADPHGDRAGTKVSNHYLLRPCVTVKTQGFARFLTFKLAD